MKSSLKMAAAEAIGSVVATEIGTAARAGEIDKAAPLIAHAGLGCVVGGIVQSDCAGGAAGAVTAEVIAGWTKNKIVVLRGLDSSSTPEQIARETRKLQSEIDDFRQKGVDVAALAGGLASATVSGKVDSGATAGRNAVEHNNGALIGLAVGAAECVAAGPGCVVAAAVAGMVVVWTVWWNDKAPGIGHNGGPKLEEQAPDNPEPKGPPPSAYVLPGMAAFEIYRQVNAYRTRNSRHRELKEIFAGGNDAGLHVSGQDYKPVHRTGIARTYEGLSDAQVKQYFTELTGQPLPSPKRIGIEGKNGMPAKEGINYVVKTKYGSFNLRNISTSSETSGARWTIDVPKKLSPLGDAVEQKFK